MPREGRSGHGYRPAGAVAAAGGGVRQPSQRDRRAHPAWRRIEEDAETFNLRHEAVAATHPLRSAKGRPTCSLLCTPDRCRRSNPAPPGRRLRLPAETRPAGGSRRAMSKARWRTCGSARSCIQPCSSRSRMAPASCSTEMAQPRRVRIAGRLSLNISIEVAPAKTNLCASQPRSACQHRAAAWTMRSGEYGTGMLRASHMDVEAHNCHGSRLRSMLSDARGGSRKLFFEVYCRSIPANSPVSSKAFECFVQRTLHAFLRACGGLRGL